MEQQKKPRAASFLLVMSWIYLVLGLGMIAFAIYMISKANGSVTFSTAMDAVFLIIGGALGFLAGIFGLVSKNLKRCRILGLILLAIAAVPLVISLLTSEPLRIYWKYIAAMALPFLYLLAALFKRSEKKPAAEPAPQSPADLSQYAASSAKKKQDTPPQPEPAVQPAPQEEKQEPDKQ